MADARQRGRDVSHALRSKGISYGSITDPDGSVGTSQVQGVDADLRVRPFYERNYDGTLRTEFLTTPLWGVGTTAPYGHDGRSVTLTEVILRHGGEARAARDRFAALSASDRRRLLEFLGSLVLFPPDDTASNLDAGNRSAAGFPQLGHGSIKLSVLFNDPTDVE